MNNRQIEDVVDHVAPARATRWLLWGLVAFAVLAVAWAALAQVDRTVRGVGRVIPRAQLQTISSLEGGAIERIHVRSGDLVKEGQSLLDLDPVERAAELGSGAAMLDALRARVERLKGEVSGREPVYPSATNAEMAAQIAIERQLGASRAADLASRMMAGRARVTQADRAIAEARAAYDAARSARRGAQSELDIVRPLVDQGLEPRLSLVQAEARLGAADGQVLTTRAAVARAEAFLAEARAELARVRQDQQTSAAEALSAAQAELSSRESGLPALERRVERTVVRAPLAGRISRVLVTTRGSAVSPGQPLIELVPSGGGLLIEARIAAQDIGKVHIDQRARVAITAYDQAVHGTLDGKVVHISPDSFTDERTGEIYYQLRVQTNEARLASATGQSLPIGTGMVAEVSLLGERRSVLSYLLTPITRLRERALRD